MTDYSELKRLAEAVIEADRVSPCDSKRVMLIDPVAVLALIAESARLATQVSTLQTDANSWQSGYDEGRRIGAKTALSERDQLKMQVEKFRIDAQDALAGQMHLFNERDLLKAEKEALRKVLAEAGAELHELKASIGFRAHTLEVLRQIDGVMSKEAAHG